MRAILCRLRACTEVGGRRPAFGSLAGAKRAPLHNSTIFRRTNLATRRATPERAPTPCCARVPPLASPSAIAPPDGAPLGCAHHLAGLGKCSIRWRGRSRCAVQADNRSTARQNSQGGAGGRGGKEGAERGRGRGRGGRDGRATCGEQTRRKRQVMRGGEGYEDSTVVNTLVAAIAVGE